MCQCLPCDCWWCNCCGVCGGFSELMCCFGFWCCKPDEMLRQSSACCYCCESSGYGGNFFCHGGVCCAPLWLQTYSKVANGKMPQQQFGGQQMGQMNQLGYGNQGYGNQGYGNQGFGQPGYGNGPTVVQTGGATIVRMWFNKFCFLLHLRFDDEFRKYRNWTRFIFI